VDCPYDEFVDAVRCFISNNQSIKTYCFMHWNYDMEKLPLPMLRKLSRKLIDVGACAVIGGHSHRPQGMEIYKNKPVVYCMGNFFLPSGIYFNGKLCYPECSKETYAVNIDNDKTDIIWYRTDINQSTPLEFVCREPLLVGEKCAEYSPFREMNDAEYLSYFAKKRNKKKLVAKFSQYFGVSYQLNEKWAIARVKIIRTLKGLINK